MPAKSETPELVSGDEPAGPGLAAAVGDLPVPVDADNRDLGNAEPVEGHGKLDRLDAGGQFPRHRVTLGDPERAQARRHRLRPVPETGEGDPAAGSVHEEFGMRGDRSPPLNEPPQIRGVRFLNRHGTE